MKSKKLKLQKMRVNSFITKLDLNDHQTIVGGSIGCVFVSNLDTCNVSDCSQSVEFNNCPAKQTRLVSCTQSTLSDVTIADC